MLRLALILALIAALAALGVSQFVVAKKIAEKDETIATTTKEKDDEGTRHKESDGSFNILCVPDICVFFFFFGFGE